MVLTVGAGAPSAALRCPNCLTSFTAGGGQAPEKSSGPSEGTPRGRSAPALSRDASTRRLGRDSDETPAAPLRPQPRASSRTSPWALAGLGAAAALVLLFAGLSFLGRGPEPKEAAVSPGPQDPARPTPPEAAKPAEPEGATPPGPKSGAGEPPSAERPPVREEEIDLKDIPLDIPIADVPISSEPIRRAPGTGGGKDLRAESSASAGLIWLAKAQEKDGHWDCKFWDGAANYDVGMTGLALLAYLGAGYTHTKGKYRDQVARGLDWLRYSQRPNGAFGYQTFYEQGIATIAVCEAYGLTRSESVRSMAQKAVDFIVQTQPNHGGFRYQGAVDKENGDLSVSGWQIVAMKSALCAELNVPMQAIERSRELLKNTLREYGGSAYTVGTPNATPAVSAIGMVCRQLLGGNYDGEINAAANYLMEQAKKASHPGFGGGQKDVPVYDLYYTYYSTVAMFQMGGEYWNQWNRMFRDPLVKLQETKSILDGRGRFIRGSWDPKDTMWGAQGGRVFSTAMALLCLEIYYRFLPVYKK